MMYKIEFIATLFYPLFIVISMIQIIGHLSGWIISIPIILFSSFLGYLFADLVAGIAHWLADRYGTTQTPIFGQFIFFFRLHHFLPKEMTKHNLVQCVGMSCLLTELFLGVFYFSTNHLESNWATLFLNNFVFISSLALVLANYFHKMAHIDQVTRLIRFLQEHHIILNKEHHKLHHTAPNNTHYCIASGWCNPFLEKIQFFSRLEKLIYSLTGIKGGDYDPQEFEIEKERILKSRPQETLSEKD